MKLPKGFFAKNKKIWIRLYDPSLGRTREFSSHLSCEVGNIRKAKEIKRQIVNALSERKLIPVKSYINISDALNIYLDNRIYTQKTISTYKFAVKHFIELEGDLMITNITTQHYNNFITRLKTQYSQNSISIYTRCLTSLFNFLVKNKYCDFNPFTRVPIERKDIKTIPVEDLQLILEYLKNNNIEGYYLIKFLYLTGLRVGEAIALKWENIDLKKGLISFYNQKSKRYDIRPLLSPAIELLMEIKLNTNREKVFIYTNTSCIFFYRTQAHLWGERDENGNLKKERLRKYHLHQLRKTFISTLVASGVSLEDTQVFSGHKDPRTTLAHYVEYRYNKIAERVNNVVEFSLPQ